MNEGALVKNNAHREVMKHRTGNPIRDSVGLFNVTKQKFPNMAIFHVSSEEIETICSAKNIQDCLDRSITIKGTRDFHHFSATNSLSHIAAKVYSASNDEKIVKISNFLDFSLHKKPILIIA